MVPRNKAREFAIGRERRMGKEKEKKCTERGREERERSRYVGSGMKCPCANGGLSVSVIKQVSEWW